MSFKPIVKWQGGKRLLLDTLRTYEPEDFTTYVEPFVGGASMLIDVLEHHPSLKQCYACDINSGLINLYQQVQKDPEAFITVCQPLQNQWLQLEPQDKSDFYKEVRTYYNSHSKDSLASAVCFKLLNAYAFGGKWSENSRGELTNTFAPAGHAVTLFFKPERIRYFSELTKGVTFKVLDYVHDSLDCLHCDSNTFTYCDPPYTPMTKKQNYTAYSATKWCSASEELLKEKLNKVTEQGGKWLLSNSIMFNPEGLNNLVTREPVDCKRCIKRGSNAKEKEWLLANYSCGGFDLQS